MGLRPMTWQDIPQLAALERELFAADAWSEQTWWAELAARPRRAYQVAEDGRGAVTGYAGLDRGGDVADVMTLAVAPAHQGKGLGRVLLKWLVEEARASGADYLMLEVRADNEPAHKLYAAAGFELLTVRRKYYQPGDVDAHIMRLDLKGASS
jgi:[ribosomal protein S18]-alanine N-acetyltransferase